MGGIAFFLVKPIVFNWSLTLALKIIVALTTGSMLSMWFAELITNENLGNGSSMVIFINIIGSIPANYNEFVQNLTSTSSTTNIAIIATVFTLYLFIVCMIVLVQEAYKKIDI